MIKPNETFDGSYPFKPHFAKINGFDMHYVDEGSGSTVLCLHGEPTWSYLYRKAIPTLTRHFRVIAPDYMGFGKSGHPQDREYTATAHIDNLEALVKQLDLKDITLVVHDWGGAIGGGLSLRQPDRISRVVVMNTSLSLGIPTEDALWAANSKESAWFGWADRAVADGTFEPTLRNSGVAIVGLMKLLQGFENSNATEDFFRAYSQPFATPDECNGVIAFPKSIVTGTWKPEINDEAAAKIRQKPAMMIEGMRDKVLLPKFFIPMFETAFPGAPIVKLETASHFLLEDEPEAIAQLIVQFYGQTSKK